MQNEDNLCPICGSPVELYINDLGEYVYCTECSFEYSISKDSAVEYSNIY